MYIYELLDDLIFFKCPRATQEQPIQNLINTINTAYNKYTELRKIKRTSHFRYVSSSQAV